MKVRLLACIFILAVLVFSVVGSTMAWFTVESSIMENVFTAGTVKISQPEIVSGRNTWKPGECNTTKLKVKNTGSKRSYLRVKPNVDIEYEMIGKGFSAWMKGIRINKDDWFGQYIEYTKGSHGASNPRKADLIQGHKENIMGHVHIWDDGTQLHIKIAMNDNSLINEIHIYAGMTVPTQTAPGQYPFKDKFNPPADEYNFATSYVYNKQATPREELNFSGISGGSNIYIGVHIDGDAMASSDDNYVDWGLADVSDLYWIKGDDGWWYYGHAQGPIMVLPGEEIYISFTFCLSQEFKGTIDFSLDAEAVQTTHGAIDYIWPDNPWKGG